MQIERERFEAWLFSQPDDRTFNPSDIRGCLVYKFLTETTNLKDFSVGGSSFHDHKTYKAHPLPVWFSGNPDPSKQLLQYHFTTFGQVKNRYIKLFGNPLCQSQCLPVQTSPDAHQASEIPIHSVS